MSTNLEVVSSTFSGSTKVTCKEAARLLNEGKVWRAFFRPDFVLSKDSENDPAFVWFNDEEKKK